MNINKGYDGNMSRELGYKLNDTACNLGKVFEISENPIEKEKYVIKTDKGYLKGDMHRGVDFVEKEEARIFDVISLHAYWDSIVDDMFEFFGVTEIDSEQI